MNIKLLDNPHNFRVYRHPLTPIQQILRNRGIEDTEEFFKHSWDCVQSPYVLDNIQKAADKIIHHCKSSATIAILVDCDADGMTSAATLINQLETMRNNNGGTWDGNIPTITYLLHDDKTHGLADTKIMKDLRDLVQPALLIIPDASGTETQYKALTDLGIDIVVLDHHEMSERGDGDKVIVVNNQQSEGYINKSLSGVGVVWQLCRVFDDMFSTSYANNWLDIVAVGLVADVMDLRSAETRFLVHEGLKPQNIRSPFLKQAAIDLAYSLGGDYNPKNVGFYIGPMFNAVLRIGTPEEKTLLFQALIETMATMEVENGKRGCKGEMVELVVEAMRQATNAKGRQKRRQDKLTGLIDEVIAEEFLFDNKVLFLAIDEFDEDQRALSGLICNKLQDYYQRPAILVFHNEDGTYSGSVRAPDNIEAFSNFREQCNDSGLVIYASGHAQAFGIKLTAKNVAEFQDFFNVKYSDINTDPTYFCDFYIKANDPALSTIITSLALYKDYWGQGIAEPVIGIIDAQIANSTITLLSSDKNPTLQVVLPNNVKCIKFRSSKEEFESLYIPFDSTGVEQCHLATIVGKAAINEWRGTITPQILVSDYEINEMGYIF